MFSHAVFMFQENLMSWFETQLCHLVLRNPQTAGKQDPEKIISASNKQVVIVVVVFRDIKTKKPQPTTRWY